MCIVVVVVAATVVVVIYFAPTVLLLLLLLTIGPHFGADADACRGTCRVQSRCTPPSSAALFACKVFVVFFFQTLTFALPVASHSFRCLYACVCVCCCSLNCAAAAATAIISIQATHFNWTISNAS